MVLSYQDKMAAQERRESSFSEKFSESLALRQIEREPKCPRMLVVLHEPDSKMVSDGISPAYMQPLMSHTK